MFADAFVALAEIGRQERILDLGCGCARLAIPLMDHLSGTGAYEGLDVMPEAIEWASMTITPRAPQFRFQVADVHNSAYNPAGTTAAAEYRFPYTDGAFDVALANSLFTHMLPAEVANYLGELRRVLRPGGRAVITYFLMDDETRGLVAGGRASIDLRHHVPPYWTTTPDKPERALGYEESYVRDLHDRAGLPIRSLSHGGWRDGSEGALFQDVVLADRP
jgi:SAM-dependent methyltransferase